MYLNGSQVEYTLNYNVFLSLKVVFILANSADPDEMQHCLPKYLFGGFKYTKG